VIVVCVDLVQIRPILLVERGGFYIKVHSR
jgi:hypothetical protein